MAIIGRSCEAGARRWPGSNHYTITLHIDSNDSEAHLYSSPRTIGGEKYSGGRKPLIGFWFIRCHLLSARPVRMYFMIALIQFDGDPNRMIRSSYWIIPWSPMINYHAKITEVFLTWLIFSRSWFQSLSRKEYQPTKVRAPFFMGIERGSSLESSLIYACLDIDRNVAFPIPASLSPSPISHIFIFIWFRSNVPFYQQFTKIEQWIFKSCVEKTWNNQTCGWCYRRFNQRRSILKEGH